MGFARRFLLLAAPAVLAACGERERDRFVAVEEEAGLRFVHVHGGAGERFFPETMGSGCALLDYDNDGWLDAYLVQAGPMPGFADPTPLPDRLFHNDGDGTFTDVTATSGTGDTSYGMGVCYGDVDNDGFVDIYVTNFGPDRLFRNDGDGTFTDVTGPAGLGDPGWNTSCAFADYDGDGHLDLYVATYVDFSFKTHIRCGRPGMTQYCHPDNYAGVPDLLYHNQGDGTFREVGREAGIRIEEPDQDKGLGVLWTDYDEDGDPDVYVANDSTPNYLFRNEGNGRFTEVASRAGVAYSDTGATQAGMGVDAGDYDNDGHIDLFVTNIDFETNELYRNLGNGSFEDPTAVSGLGPPSLLQVGFGTNFLDHDNDGDLDVMVINGHVLDVFYEQKPTRHHAQNTQLYDNDGKGRFSDVSARSGAYLSTLRVGRGAAFGDVDNDGDTDVLIANNNQGAVLLRNQTDGRGNWLLLRLRSRHGGRDAFGARLELTACGSKLVREVRSTSSYLSQGDPRVHFGLAQCARVDGLEIRWPGGLRQAIDGAALATNRIHVIDEPAP